MLIAEARTAWARVRWAAVFVAGGWLLSEVVRYPDQFGMLDLRVYRAGGEALRQGLPLYSAHPVGSGLPFTYPPFAGLLCVPLAALDWTSARLVITAVSLGALVMVVRATVRAAGLPVPVAAPFVLAAGLCLEPVQATLGFGQVNLLVLALVVVDLTGRADRPSTGMLVGVAAAVKLTPLIFVVYLFVTGRRRAAGTALATFAGTVALGWLMLPGESTRYWFSLVLQPDRVGGVAYSGNQSLLGALSRLAPGPARPVWVVLAVVVAALGLYGAAALSAAGRELAGVAACGLTGLLVSPISWTHHWVWVLPAAVAAAGWAADRAGGQVGGRVGGWVGAEPGRAGSGRSRLLPGALLAAGGLVFVVAPVWWPPYGGDREVAHTAAERLAANSYVLVGAAVLAAVVTWAVHRRRRHQALRVPVST